MSCKQSFGNSRRKIGYGDAGKWLGGYSRVLASKITSPFLSTLNDANRQQRDRIDGALELKESLVLWAWLTLGLLVRVVFYFYLGGDGNGT